VTFRAVKRVTYKVSTGTRLKVKVSLQCGLMNVERSVQWWCRSVRLNESAVDCDWVRLLRLRSDIESLKLDAYVDIWRLWTCLIKCLVSGVHSRQQRRKLNTNAWHTRRSYIVSLSLSTLHFDAIANFAIFEQF